MDRPPAPSEAVVIRLAREAADIRMAEAAKRAGVSVARWAQIETGSEMRRGSVNTVTGRAGTIARMAHAVGVTPERLEAAGNRPDAAEILREITRQQAAAVPDPESLPAAEPEPRRPSGDPEFTPEIAELMAPRLPAIEIAIEVARRRYPGQPLTGARIFPLKPDDADSWDRLAADDRLSAGDRDPEAAARRVARRLAAVQAWEAELAAGEHGGTAAGLIRA